MVPNKGPGTCTELVSLSLIWFDEHLGTGTAIIYNRAELLSMAFVIESAVCLTTQALLSNTDGRIIISMYSVALRNLTQLQGSCLQNSFEITRR